jgi:hypothetical protein
MKVLADNLAVAAVGGGALRHLPPVGRRWVASQVARRLALRVARLERHAPGLTPLSSAGQEGLNTYLSGPLVQQFRRECPEALLEPVVFSFGHTHKPFAATQTFDGFRLPLRLYNTGGWVVDSLASNQMHGAAAVLFDEDLNAASLRLFDLRPATPPGYVRVQTASGSLDNPLASRLGGLMDPKAEPWSAFTAHLGPEVVRHVASLKSSIAQGVAAARARPVSGVRQPA